MLIFILATTGYFVLPKASPTSHSLAMATFALIGLGSVLFHGTLRHMMQLLGRKILREKKMNDQEGGCFVNDTNPANLFLL